MGLQQQLPGVLTHRPAVEGVELTGRLREPFISAEHHQALTGGEAQGPLTHQ